MTDPGRRSISYLPGRWAALVTDDLCLLGDVQLADPLLASCWEAADAADAAGVLAVLSRAVQRPGFVLVARQGEAMRLVVGGRAHAEVFSSASADDAPAVRSAPEPNVWLDEPLDPALDVRLVADDATSFERMSPLPLTSGIVLASYVFSTAVGAVTGGFVESAPDDVAGWIPPPLTQRSSEFPVPAIPLESAEPAPQLSGVFRALPWRASFGAPDPAEEQPAPGFGFDAADDDSRLDTVEPQRPVEGEPPAPPPAADVAKPSFGAPGYEPPPPSAEAWGWQGWAPEPEPPSLPTPAASYGADPYPPPPPPSAGVAYPPPPAFSPPPPLPGVPPAPSADVPAPDTSPVVGVLHLPSGEDVPVDRDVLLGRAPFAADPSNVRIVEVASPENDISRSHVRISVEGWQAFATDLGSTNGTAVTLPGQPQTLLRPHEPFALAPGAVLALADEAEIRFDAQ